MVNKVEKKSIELPFVPPPGFESAPIPEVWHPKPGDELLGEFVAGKRVKYASTGKPGITVELMDGKRSWIVTMNESAGGDFIKLKARLGDMIYVKCTASIDTGKANEMMKLRWSVERKGGKSAPISEEAPVEEFEG